jgi:hypothetical protein
MLFEALPFSERPPEEPGTRHRTRALSRSRAVSG